MKEVKQSIRDAQLTMQDVWKMVRRRNKLTPGQRQVLVIRLKAARRWIDEALEKLGADAETEATGRP